MILPLDGSLRKLITAYLSDFEKCDNIYDSAKCEIHTTQVVNEIFLNEQSLSNCHLHTDDRGLQWCDEQSKGSKINAQFVKIVIIECS